MGVDSPSHTVAPNEAEMPSHESGTASSEHEPIIDSQEVKARIHTWLHDIGLGDSNPFEQWDAGADPELHRYLVRRDVLDLLLSDSPVLVFAPPGGGKSAFRVRLAWACRVDDQRRIFAIPYIAPPASAMSLTAHLPVVLARAARELLLMLAYRPALYLDLDQAGRRAVRGVLDQNDPGLVARFRPQLERAGSLAPLVESFDRSAAHLDDLPEPEDVRALCSALRDTPVTYEEMPASQRFETLLEVLRHTLGYEGIYLLVDGVDAWHSTQSNPEQAARVVQPLLETMRAWAERGLFLKLFLPLELRTLLPSKLTKDAQSVIIKWDLMSLAEVLHRRLSAASKGKFGSLDAIIPLSVPGAEERLLRATRTPPTPRELLVLVNLVIEEHVLRSGAGLRLELRDVQAAIDRYHGTMHSS